MYYTRLTARCTGETDVSAKVFLVNKTFKRFSWNKHDLYQSKKITQISVQFFHQGNFWDYFCWVTQTELHRHKLHNMQNVMKEFTLISVSVRYDDNMNAEVSLGFCLIFAKHSIINAWLELNLGLPQHLRWSAVW